MDRQRRRMPFQLAAAAALVGVLATAGSAPGQGQGQKAAAPAPAARTAPQTPAGTSARSVAHLPGYSPDRNAYFGDLHVHTGLSFDAYIFNVRATPDDAYRFAKGDTIGHASGFNIRRSGGPLDFTAVTDHSEYMGAMREANDPASPLSKQPIVQGLFSPDPKVIGAAFNKIVGASHAGTMPEAFSAPDVAGRAWTEVQQAAARHNDPGRFTTFVGYEYTSAPDGRNLHRNVIFRTGKVPELPYTARGAPGADDPETLWRTMDRWRARGIDVLAIPHNSNGSDGLMFEPTKRNGAPMDRAYAELRMRNEPLVEITQIKGTSEVHPSLSPNDEWVNFEIMERYIGGSAPVTKFHGGYVREALKDGILMRENVGFNPFKFGFIGSSDTHNAAPGSVEERNYFSKVGRSDGQPRQRGSTPPDGGKTWPADTPDSAHAATPYQAWGASGLAGVWAEENSREAIFAAMRRKETFATSGPRIRVRFFASYDYPDDLARRTDLVREAYARGVPMGGELAASTGKVPKFLIWGVRDPNSGYLQRAQVVKGWVENGVAREQVFDVACSDKLPLNRATWRCPDNGAGVNMATCEPDPQKGDVELRTLWTDPTFKPKQRAFYYLRVLENPSCRWSTWDALRNGTPPNPTLAKTLMERAWSSPIWYEPKA